jgi:Fe-S oxidoreductase
MEKITGLLKGREVSEEAYEMVYGCNGGCDICSKACPEKLNPYSAFTSAIARIAGAGRQPPPRAYQVMPKYRHSFHRVFSALQSKPSERRWMTRAPANPKSAEVVLFAGCNATGMIHTFVETMAILDKMEIDYVALSGDELCCGTSAMLWGDLDAAQAMGEELVSNIAAFGPKKAVHFCTGCHVMCWAMLPRFIPVPFQSYELTQFLVENIDRIPFRQRIDKVVAVHDACSLARLGTFENPRNLLQAMGCSHGQGYLFGPPMTEAEFLLHVTSGARRPDRLGLPAGGHAGAAQARQRIPELRDQTGYLDRPAHPRPASALCARRRADARSPWRRARRVRSAKTG